MHTRICAFGQLCGLLAGGVPPELAQAMSNIAAAEAPVSLTIRDRRIHIQ